jgi:ABC-type phosphate transport system substrate-binding protein
MKILFCGILVLIIINISNAQVAVIANKSVKAEKISKTELLDFYIGDIKKWKDGQKVFVFDLKPKTKIKETFYKFLGKSSSRMKSIWMKRKLTGNGDPPPALDSDKEMLKKVEATKGAIGFVNYDSVNTKIKVLSIIEMNEK